MTGVAAVAEREAIVLAGGRVLRTYEGLEPTEAILDAVRAGRAAGVTLFRAANVGSPAELRVACAALQSARPAGDPPLVIGLDQEGGQLQAVGHGATAWPGAMALGATGSVELARAAGAAIGAEVAAMGATLVFAPVCDVIARSSATPLGTRSFGSDPTRVAALAGAFTAGLQSAGVAATLKHFPGHGAAGANSHVGLPVVDGPGEWIRERNLPPFRAGIAAGALVVMPGHLAVPGLTDGRIEAATISRTILGAVLREEMGFEGVAVSDALDMGGAGDADRLDETVVAAAEAGIDLLLLNHDVAAEEAVVEALSRAILSGRHGIARARASTERVLALRRRLGRGSPPPLEVVGSPEHRTLARRIAEASITLVRDERRDTAARGAGRRPGRPARPGAGGPDAGRDLVLHPTRPCRGAPGPRPPSDRARRPPRSDECRGGVARLRRRGCRCDHPRDVRRRLPSRPGGAGARGRGASIQRRGRPAEPL